MDSAHTHTELCRTQEAAWVVSMSKSFTDIGAALTRCCISQEPCGCASGKLHSNAHWFSLLTSSSSSGVKSFLM